MPNLEHQNCILKTVKPSSERSCGVDGISQEHLKMGERNLITPLLIIYNKSIQEGSFPTVWKEAVVTPVLKKGDSEKMAKHFCIKDQTVV